MNRWVWYSRSHESVCWSPADRPATKWCPCRKGCLPCSSRSHQRGKRKRRSRRSGRTSTMSPCPRSAGNAHRHLTVCFICTLNVVCPQALRFSFHLPSPRPLPPRLFLTRSSSSRAAVQAKRIVCGQATLMNLYNTQYRTGMIARTGDSLTVGARVVGQSRNASLHDFFFIASHALFFNAFRKRAALAGKCVG